MSLAYKIVVLDLDGTLLNQHKVLSPAGIQVLSALRSLNIEIVVATGRRYRFARELFKKAGFPVTILCSSGSLAMNTAGDRRIMARYIDERVFHDIVRRGREYSLHPLLHVDHFSEGYDFILEYEKDSPSYRSYLTGVNEYRVVGDFSGFRPDRVLLMCFMDELQILERFQEVIQKECRGFIHSHIVTTLKRIGPVLEVMNPLGTKWMSLLDYAAASNIRPDEIVAMGDDNNDIQMVSNAGLGIAMKNGTDEVKAAAKAITLYTNDEDGVARALTDIFNLPKHR